MYDADSNTFSPYVDVPERGNYAQVLKVNQTHIAFLAKNKFYLFNR